MTCDLLKKYLNTEVTGVTMPRHKGVFIPHSHCTVASGDCFTEKHGNHEIKIPFGKEFEDWRKKVEAELKIADLINETLDRTIGRLHSF